MGGFGGFNEKKKKKQKQNKNVNQNLGSVSTRQEYKMPVVLKPVRKDK